MKRIAWKLRCSYGVEEGQTAADAEQSDEQQEGAEVSDPEQPAADAEQPDEQQDDAEVPDPEQTGADAEQPDEQQEGAEVPDPEQTGADAEQPDEQREDVEVPDPEQPAADAEQPDEQQEGAEVSDSEQSAADAEQPDEQQEGAEVSDPEQPAADAEQPDQQQESADGEAFQPITEGFESTPDSDGEPSPLPFEQTKVVDGVAVTVRAEPGVFPANAQLSVKRVSSAQRRQADAAVDALREENVDVAASYTFDIKVIDPETGEEYQPAQGQTVSVSFALDEVADESLETSVYHITEDENSGELTAESLPVNTGIADGETTVTVETDGFSMYTVEITHSNATVASVTFVECSWDGNKVVSSDRTEKNVKAVPTDGKMTSGWYVLNSNVTVDGRVSLTGNTNLILGDGYTLDVKGIYIPEEYTLTIYGQSNESGRIVSHPNTGAAIGSAPDNHPGGKIVIHGGSIEATGAKNCAGIGSNSGNKTTSPITIYGGEITAQGGENGAGIGGGENCDGGRITIYGGKRIKARGGSDGAGIGGDSGTVTVEAGEVHAGGNREDSQGHGIYMDSDSSHVYIKGGTVYADGFGKGEGKFDEYQYVGISTYSSAVEITGGTVVAHSIYGTGIGGTTDGYYSTGSLLITGNNTVVRASSDRFPGIGAYEWDSKKIKWTFGKGPTIEVVSGGKLGMAVPINPAGTRIKAGDGDTMSKWLPFADKAQAHKKYRYRLIEPCDHMGTVDESGVCTLCGGKAPLYTVTFKDGDTTISSQNVYLSRTATKPENPVHRGHTFNGWDKDGRRFIFSTPITGNTTLTADWSYNTPKVSAIPDQSYTGKAITPPVTVKDGKETLVEGVDYRVAYANNIVTGTATVTVVGKGDYVNSSRVEANFNIVKAGITPVVTIADWTYGETPSEPVVEGNPENGMVTFIYTGDGYSGDKPPVNGGVYLVVATVAPTDNYLGGSASAEFRIQRATFSPSVSIADWSYGETPSTPVVSGNAGNGPVTYLYAVRDSQQYRGGAPEYPGEYTVKAMIAPTNNYISGEATANFTVKKASFTPDVAISDWEYGDTPSVPRVKNNPGAGKVSYAYKAKGGSDSTYRTEVPAGVGDYTVRATVAASDYYNTATGTANFRITKATIHPVLTVDDWVYNRKPSDTPAVEDNPEGGRVTFTYKVKGADDSTYSEKVPIDAGEYAVKATVAETAHYKSATVGPVAFRIRKLKAVVSVAGDYSTVASLPADGASASGIELSAEDGDKQVLKSHEIEEIRRLVQGNAKITRKDDPPVYSVGLAWNDQQLTSNYDIAFKPVQYVIQDGVTVLARGYHGVYDETAHGISVSVPTAGVSDLRIDYRADAASDWSAVNPSFTNVTDGAKTVYYRVTGKINGTAFAEITGSGTVQIDRADINPSVSISSWAYGATPATPVLRGKYGDGQVTYSYRGIGYGPSKNPPANAGKYLVTATVSESANYNGAVAETDFSIYKATPVVTPPAAGNLIYNGKAQALAEAGEATCGEARCELLYAVTPAGKTPADGEWNSAVPTRVDAGTYRVWFKVEGNENINAVEPDYVQAIIRRRDISGAVVLLSEDRFDYDGHTQKSVAVASVKLDGAALTQYDYTVTGTLSEMSAGEYTVVVSGAGNYCGHAEAGWRIVPMAINIVARDVEAVYDGKPHGIFVPYSGGAEIEYGTEKGVYDLKASPTLTDVGELVVYYHIPAYWNYQGCYGQARITVTAQPIRPVAVLEGWTYGKTPQAPSVQGNPGNGKVTYTYSATRKGPYSADIPTDAGTWYVRASVEANGNYLAGTSEPRSFVISKANITVTADNLTGQVGEKIKKLTWRISGDYRDGDPLIISATTTATSESPAGKYPIALEWGGHKNYNAVLKKGVYTITGAPKPTVKPTATPTVKPTVKPTATPTATPRPDYTLLAKMTAEGKTTLKLSWSKVEDAEGYDVYFARCGKDRKFRKIATVNASVRSYEINSVKSATSYRACVKAWKRVRGKRKTIGKASPIVHAIAGGYTERWTNAKAVQVKYSSLTLAKGKAGALKASVTGWKSGNKVLKHTRLLRYFSSNANVATVSSTGVVKAVGGGSCRI